MTALFALFVCIAFKASWHFYVIGALCLWVDGDF